MNTELLYWFYWKVFNKIEKRKADQKNNSTDHLFSLVVVGLLFVYFGWYFVIYFQDNLL